MKFGWFLQVMPSLHRHNVNAALSDSFFLAPKKPHRWFFDLFGSTANANNFSYSKIYRTIISDLAFCFVAS